MARNEFGDTCPVLNVARKHGLDYADCLLGADALIRPGVVPASRLATVRERIPDLAWADLGRVADRFHELQAGQP